VGLTPTTDEHSIKVEGTGSAIITDITVELLPNREIFEDIYPESDDDEEDKSDFEVDEYAEKVNETLDEVRDKIQALEDEQKRSKEIVSSAESRLKILDAYGNSLDKKRGVDIETSVETYRKEREKVFHDHMAGTVRERELLKEILNLRKEEARLYMLVRKEEIKVSKAKAKIARAKAREALKEQRRKAERAKERTRVRKERENFWARSCYSVRITLDAAIFTPSSSRRSSIASASDVKVISEKETADTDVAHTCDLSLSYVTSSAFWSPSYDLALSTTANTGLLCFDAQLTNMTSETWVNSKVTLSTSQTTFSGLQDAIPALVPWRVKLAGKWTGGVQNELIDSKEERTHQGVWQAAQMANYAQKPRAQYFGVSEQLPKQYMNTELLAQSKRAAMAQPPVQAQQMQQQMQQQAWGGSAQDQLPAGIGMNLFGAPPPLAQPAGSGLFGTGFGANNSNTGGGGLGYGSLNITSNTSAGLFGASSFQPMSNSLVPSSNIAPLRSMKKGKAAADDQRRQGSSLVQDDGYAPQDDEEDGDTILEATPELSFQESAFEETGLTATYDLPNLKTLKPSSTASKQRVARVSFSNVYFSHTVVAKYKPAAYLKAKLRNTSKLTLLKGPTGLTLDGTFMGRSTLPRCSAGDTFTMSLGVDPAIRVAYPKPDVKRSTTGVFTKGDNSVYTRTITLVNTRATAGKPVNITVLDQVPVSEDEKLRIDILHPRGMYAGSGVPTGIAGKDGKDEKDWGKATATLKKAGEVSWDVVLNAGRSARLTLEYDVAFPTGDRVVQC